MQIEPHFIVEVCVLVVFLDISVEWVPFVLFGDSTLWSLQNIKMKFLDSE